MHTVAVAISEGAPIFEVAVPAEIFGIARPDILDPWYEFRLCGPQPGSIRLAGGFSLETSSDWQGLEKADTVLVPACVNVHAEQPAALLASLRVAASRGARIASICSGAFVLAAAGLLDGRRATTHWLHADELRRRFPSVRVDAGVLYEQDGRIFTSAGTAAGIDLCLELIRQDHGAAVANRVARRLVVPPHRAGGQAQYLESPVPSTDDDFGSVLEWARAHLDERLTLGMLASVATVSERTLARRFRDAVGTSPKQWLIQQRVRRAQELLEVTELSVEHVSELVGFEGGASLRDHFQRIVGVSPLAYRATFRRAEPLSMTEIPA